MKIAHDGSVLLRKAIADKLIADFDVDMVNGITDRPTITRTITAQTPEPYIYIREEYNEEDWSTKTSESRKHFIAVEVVCKELSGRGTHDQRDQIVDEVLRLIDQPTYLRVTGFTVQLIRSPRALKMTIEEKGARYFKSVINFEITMIKRRLRDFIEDGFIEPVFIYNH